MKDKALKLALEALEELQGGCTDSNDGTVEAITVWCPEVIEEIKIALAQPAQEPVALTDDEIWKFWWNKPEVLEGEDDSMEAQFVSACRKAIKAEAQRPWIGLTDEHLLAILGDELDSSDEAFLRFARAVEAAHGIEGAA